MTESSVPTLADLLAEGVSGRAVLVRSDLNVPLDNDGEITDPGRIIASVPTLKALVDAGANLVLVPSEWVRGPLKEAHWRTLITARAIENTIYVAAADQTSPMAVGNSMIVDPMGVEIVTLGEIMDVAVATISLDRISSVRILNPALELRRFAVTAK